VRPVARRHALAIALLLGAVGCNSTALGDREGRQPKHRTLVFQDNFNGTRLDSRRWDAYFSPGHDGNGLRRPSAISLNGKGLLVVTARMRGGQVVSGGMAATRGFTYGQFEARVRTEPDPSGTTSGVILTWPNSGNWPVDGENDIYETGARRGTRRPFNSYIHYGADNKQFAFTHRADGTRWHTLTMDWSASAIRIYRDHALVGTVTDRDAIPDVPHHLTIQLDAMNDNKLVKPVRMYVDYVRIWR
jgi:beta-glucanase (GH16 family)